MESRAYKRFNNAQVYASNHSHELNFIARNIAIPVILQITWHLVAMKR